MVKLFNNIFVLSFLMLPITPLESTDLKAANKSPEVTDYPVYNQGEVFFADIDTAGQRLLVLLNETLWQYDLQSLEWSLIDSLKFPESLKKLEFGYNPVLKRIRIWSSGIGKVYDLDPETMVLTRIDGSHDHRNQYGHYPFFRDGKLYGFGGYGYWEWHNILTFYNPVINEWNIYNITNDSPFPEKRAPYSGVYVTERDELYIFGGESSERPDDQRVKRVFRKDVWRLSFAEGRWENLFELSEPDLTFYNPPATGKTGRTNSISSSFYVPEHNIWFIPMTATSHSDNTYYLKPVNLRSQTSYPAIETSFGSSQQFLPTHFFYNPGNNKAVIAGFDYLTNSERYPVRIRQIDSDSLISSIDSPPFFAVIPYMLYLGTGSGLVLLFVLFLWRRKPDTESAGLDVMLSAESIEKMDYLSENEKRLLEYFFAENKYVESQEIEELLWSDIESYDYQRKLRNDLIKAINRKFRSNSRQNRKLIKRKIDPNDNRRFLYGLNEELISSANIKHF